MSGPSGPNVILTQGSSSPGTPQNADDARLAGDVRKGTDCFGIFEAKQQQTLREESFVYGSSAVVQKQRRADWNSDSRGPLLPSALDRRICPEPIQVRSCARRGTQPHILLRSLIVPAQIKGLQVFVGVTKCTHQRRLHLHMGLYTVLQHSGYFGPCQNGSMRWKSTKQEGRASQDVFQSCCHVPDLYADASCRQAAECGVDALLCRPRTCSQHGWCITPPQVRNVPPSLGTAK